MILSVVDIYTDGSCLKNPGMGGYGYIIRYTEDDPSNPSVPKFVDIEKSQGYRYTTNNRMEIMAAIFGIKDIINNINIGVIKGCTQINLFSDSEYLCNSVNNRWINKWMDNNWMTSSFGGKSPKPVKNKDLWEELIKVQNDIRNLGVSLIFNWVKGHDTNEMNNKADKLAVSASTGTNHIIDEVWEQTSGLLK